MVRKRARVDEEARDEAFRILRTSVILCMADLDRPTILITSAVYAWIGTTISERIANIIAAAMAVATLAGVIVYLVKFH